MSLNGITHSLSKLFSKKSHKDERATEIGLPTNVKQHVHVSKNSITGTLEGLPNSWLRLMNTQITQAEQDENPNAAYQAVKFYNYSIKKKEPIEPFKPFVTEDVITEESLEIDKLLDTKNAHKSQDSDISIGQSSEEDVIIPELPDLTSRQTMPAMPSRVAPPKPTTQVDMSAVVQDLTLIGVESEESPILRKKEIYNASLSDNEIYAELRTICNKDDPHTRFERVKDLGAGASGKQCYIIINSLSPA